MIPTRLLCYCGHDFLDHQTRESKELRTPDEETDRRCRRDCNCPKWRPYRRIGEPAS